MSPSEAAFASIFRLSAAAACSSRAMSVACLTTRLTGSIDEIFNSSTVNFTFISSNLANFLALPFVLRQAIHGAIIEKCTLFERCAIGSHVWLGFNPSNINHGFCHYTDDVTHIAGLQSQQHRETQ
jgi:hypothetical protein